MPGGVVGEIRLLLATVVDYSPTVLTSFRGGNLWPITQSRSCSASTPRAACTPASPRSDARSKRPSARLHRRDVPGMRIGIIAHGDYCDKGSSYVTKALQAVRRHRRRSVQVRPGGRGRPAAAICPSATSSCCTRRSRSVVAQAAHKQVRWCSSATTSRTGPSRQPRASSTGATEIDKLGGLKHSRCTAFSVLNRRHATKFYEELAHKSGGFHVSARSVLVCDRPHHGGLLPAVLAPPR
jgi:hypothetical protein